MSGKARRVPLAHLKNGVATAEDGTAIPQGKPKGPKGRLALLKEENARLCAPKTRIPTPAPKKKSSLVAPSHSTFVSKIPSPNSSPSTLEGPQPSQGNNGAASTDVQAEQEQQQGSPQVQAPAFGTSDSDREAVTPEAQLQGHAELGDMASEALQLSDEMASQLASTPQGQVSLEASHSSAHNPVPSSSPHVEGMGTPLDFTGALNLDDIDSSTLLMSAEEATFGSIVGGAECTPAAEKALKAWLAANTPSQPGRGSAYTGNQTPGRLLATPAMQGLLQQLRISTPALGAEGIASTPFLAGLARTLPELTPGITPDAGVLWGAQGSSPSDSPPATTKASLRDPQNATNPAPTQEGGNAAEDGMVPASPDQAQGPRSPSDAWAELVDLTPGPRDHSDVSLWVSPMGGSPGSCAAAAPGSPSFADGCPAVADAAAERRSPAARQPVAHKKHVSWGSDTEHSFAQPAPDQATEAAAQPDAESVGSASPAEAARPGAAGPVRAASDDGASATDKMPLPQDAASAAATPQATATPKQLCVADPVNPAAPAVKPSGIGRGSAGLPRAAETCQVIHPPPVPSTTCLLPPADESAEGTLAPANTPVDPAHAAHAAPLTTYQLMLAHIVGGAYVSPTVGRPGSPGPALPSSPATPHGQRARSYTPCLLATPAGTVPRTRSRLGPGGLAGAIAAARTPVTLLRRPPRTPATLRGFLATPPQLRSGFGPAARGTPGTALSVGRGSLESWLARTGLGDKVDSPARASLEALWARAGQAGSLRLEIETVRVAEQERALAEARQHLQQWDALMHHNASLEAENAELRSELAAVAATREAAEAAAARASAERAVAAEAAAGQQALAAAEAERCKETGLRLLELADHAALVAAAYEDEKQALLEELAVSRQRLAAAQDAATCAHMSPATSDRQLAAVETQLQEARQEYSDAMAACEAAQEAAAAAAEEKARLLSELQEARSALHAAAAAADRAGAAHDGEAACLAAQLKEAHEALYELEMDALEAQRITQETHNMLALEDAQYTIVADEEDIKEMQQVVEAASDANRAFEEENERLRAELQAAQQQLAAVQQQQPSLDEDKPATGKHEESAGGNGAPQPAEAPKEDDSTPTKRPSETAALVSATAAAHAAPVTFYGSHRVFLGPRTADAPAAGIAAKGASAVVARRQATPQSASPVAAWCTVTDRLRRLRADLEDTSNTMHLLRSARKAPLQLPAPDQAAPTPCIHPEDPPAAQPSPIKLAAPEAAAMPQAQAASPAPAAQTESNAEMEEAAAGDVRQREETPEAAAERIQLVLRIGHLTPPQEPVEACTPEPKKALVREEAESSPEMDTPVQQPRFGLWGRRGGARKKASASEEREFRRRAAALKIRISPYFNRRREAAGAE